MRRALAAGEHDLLDLARGARHISELIVRMAQDNPSDEPRGRLSVGSGRYRRERS
jgi:hypothetical protein